MENSKRRTSAVQRRELERQQRRQQNKKQRRRRASAGNPWLLLTGILVIVVVIVGVFLLVANQQTKTSTAGQDGSGATGAFKTISSLDPTLLASVGAGSAKNLMSALPANTTIPKGPHGRPMVLYGGADYCPYCAAQRWSLIIALSRFGQFAHVNALTSSEGGFLTYTFYQSTYTSQYVDFVSLETADNQGNKLEAPTAEQVQLISTYNAPPYTNSKGSIPFLLIGNKQTSTGAYYSPDVLTGLSYADIVNQLKDPDSAVAQGMLGAANDLTAAICQVTNEQPASVCNSSPIPSIQQSLPTPGTASGTDHGEQASLFLPDQAILSRRRQ